MKVGDQVSWIDGRGEKRFGTVSMIDDNGRVYIASAQTNVRGKPRTRVVEFWFEPDELGRLTVKP